MVNALPEMVDHVKDLFKGYDYTTSSVKVLVGYDTQFELTNGYVNFILSSISQWNVSYFIFVVHFSISEHILYYFFRNLSQKSYTLPPIIYST